MRFMATSSGSFFANLVCGRPAAISLVNRDVAVSHLADAGSVFLPTADRAQSGRLRVLGWGLRLCPVETLTLLFTDIEGSTALLRRLGAGVYGQALADHHSFIRLGLAAHGGEEVDTQGDAFFAVFS